MNYFLNINQSQRCLIGAILVKIGQALLLTWGKSNVYYYSYYRQFEPDLSVSLNTIPIALMALPLALLSVYSISLGQYFGIVRMIRGCALIQLITLLIAPYQKTYIMFILFFLIIVGLCYSLLVFPLLKCLWSHYSHTEGKVTGILFAFFGLSTLIFLLSITYIINPDNQHATETIYKGLQEYKFFTPEDVENVPNAVMITGIAAGLSSTIGSLFISLNTETKVDIEMKELKTKLLPNETKALLSAEVLEAIKTQSFRNIFLMYFFASFFEVTLGLNYKSYGLSKINNDQLLTWVDTCGIVVASLSNFLWGRLIDIYDFKQIFVKVFIAMGILAMLFPICIINQISFVIQYLTLSIVTKGAIVILGPGLLKIFGGDVGTQIIPIINIGTLIAFVASPIFQWLFIEMIEFDGIFILQGLFIIMSAYLGKQIQAT
ncbi:hypothetical protein pb186bvf_010414 [Paramecium bursaria]